MSAIHSAILSADRNSLVAGLDLLVSAPGIIYFTMGPTVFDADPFFVGGGDYHLRSPSFAIDRGTADGAPMVDIDGVERPIDGDGDGVPAVDMGAYESPPALIWRVYLPQLNNCNMQSFSCIMQALRGN